MARKNLNVSGPIAEPPVAADVTLLKPNLSFNDEKRSLSARKSLFPLSTAFKPLSTITLNSHCVTFGASKILDRMSAAICSHNLGAPNIKVGPTSRISSIAVSGLSGKLTFIPPTILKPTPYVCSIIHGKGKTDTYSSSIFLGSTFKYLITCSINFPPGNIANFGSDVVPEVVHKIAS